MSQRARSLIDWMKIYALPISVVLLGLLLSAGVFHWLRSSRDHRVQRRFAVLAGSRAENLESKLQSYASILQLVTDFYHSTKTVSRYRFQSLTGGILDRHDEISSLQWMPSVPGEERQTYLAKLREEGFSGVTLTPVDSDGDTRDDGPDRYFPVTFVEPTLPGRKASLVGFDYLSGPSRRSLLKRTVEQNVTSSLVNSPSLRSMSNKTNDDTAQRVFVLLRAVYGGEHMFVRDRWANLSGFLALEVPHRALLDSVFPPEGTEDLKPFVYGETTSETYNLLYSHGKEPPEASNRDRARNWWTFERDIQLGDKTLTVIMNPTDSYLSDRRTAYPWVVFLLGLGLTGLLGQLSYSLSGEYLSREKQFYSVFDNAPYAIATVDDTARIDLWNDSARRMFGYEDSEARGRNLFELLEFTDEDDPVESLDDLVETDGASEEEFREVRARDRDGRAFPVNLGLRRWELQGSSFFTVMAEDITERKRYQEKIERLARRDNLTDLFNRGTFMEKLQEEFERVDRYEQELSVIMMDVDHFKNINDTHGHLAGDEILKGIAESLRENTRSTDFPGRYGGEEFCVALPETALNRAEELAERIRKLIRDAEYYEDVTVTCSFGVAAHDGSVEELDDLLNRADEALYRSKENGRDRTTVWEEREDS